MSRMANAEKKKCGPPPGRAAIQKTGRLSRENGRFS
jgi:hypothetical protein